MNTTGISWCDATWNPVTGCTPISEACANCYAKTVAETRLRGRGGYDQDNPFAVQLRPERLAEPTRKTKPRLVFTCSMSDLFHADVPEDYIKAVYLTMARARQHTYIVLTKRAERMLELTNKWIKDRVTWREGLTGCLPAWIWHGVTAENQRRLDERAPLLLQVRSAVHLLSCEPLLEPINFEHVQWPGKWPVDILRGGSWDVGIRVNRKKSFVQHSDMNTIDWVIVGGESGGRARPMDPDWAEQALSQCRSGGVPFFMKQMSGRNKIPQNLMVREFPKVWQTRHHA